MCFQIMIAKAKRAVRFNRIADQLPYFDVTAPVVIFCSPKIDADPSNHFPTSCAGTCEDCADDEATINKPKIKAVNNFIFYSPVVFKAVISAIINKRGKAANLGSKNKIFSLSIDGRH